MKRLRLTPRNLLWAAVVVAVALIGITLYAQRDAGEREERVDAVRSYIAQVNIVHGGLVDEIERMNEAYEQFARNPDRLARVQPQLDAGVEAMHMLGDRVNALAPPEEAEPLHAEITELVRMETALAEEVRDMGLTFAVMISESERLGKVGDRLVADLEGSDSLATQADAFAAYANGVRKIADRLSRAAAPAALAPGLENEVKRLRRLVRLATETRTALLEERTEDARAASDELARAASGAAAVTRAQRQAIREYQRRIRELRNQEGQVEVELRRLSGVL